MKAAVLFLATCPLAAQLFTGAVVSEGMGYQRAAPALGASLDTPRVQVLAWAAPLHKQAVGDGWGAWCEGCAPLVRGFGPAILVRYTANSAWTRLAAYPSVCWSHARGGFRVTVTGHLRDQWSAYHAAGGTARMAQSVGPVRLLTGLTVLRWRGAPAAGLTWIAGAAYRVRPPSR